MCSVSLIRSAATLRVVMNRDEQCTRAAGLPPLLVTHGGRGCLRTVDGTAGGAWIGVNDRGLVACLLNHTPPGGQPYRGRRSRGEVVPAVLAASDLATATAALTAFAKRDFTPWTVVLADGQSESAWRWDGGACWRLPPSRCWVSSGLGDDRVERPRWQAWRQRCASTANGLADATAQDAWHRSRDGEDSIAWVLMRRADARTVSRSELTVDPTAVTLREALLDDDGQETQVWQQSLPRSDL